VSASESTPRPEQERRFVDIDPWAVLLEQLMDVPEEEPAERSRTKAK
jgi:hypothetical protein